MENPGCAHQGALGDDVLGDPSCAIRLVSFWLEGIGFIRTNTPDMVGWRK